MSLLKLYSVFHLNLAFSSIGEEQRPDVIRRCYWLLLRLAEENRLPIGIEATGYTLETAAAIDPAWVEELRRLTTEGPCEFIGSGYAQIIGPLVPAQVNDWNQKIGKDIYEKILGIEPKIAIVNEMAYSAGMVECYLNNGYQSIIMEWNNPRRY
ncbi:MAG: glycoside hydrolase family 57, partial [Deltaproteobacteria bacterium]|nr:glycoside hydrolase family 57 [Deltaproteobacteria bacterium]